MQWLSRAEKILGKDKLEKLQNTHIAVFGLGGVGGLCTEALARTGIGRFTLIDADTFEESNLNRQAFSNTQTIGQYKTQVLKENILKINPKAQITTFSVFADKTNIDQILKVKPDAVIDAIDSVQSKCFLLEYCLKNNIKVFSSMGAALKTDPLKIKTADLMDTQVCPLAKIVRTTLSNDGFGKGVMCVYSTEKSIKKSKDEVLGSYAPVTGTFALVLADLAIKHLSSQY